MIIAGAKMHIAAHVAALVTCAAVAADTPHVILAIAVTFTWRGPTLWATLRAIRNARLLENDIIVEGKVILELKSVELLAKVHSKQLFTYLKLADKRLGLLLNFGANLMKEGIKRIANGMDDTL